MKKTKKSILYGITMLTFLLSSYGMTYAAEIPSNESVKEIEEVQEFVTDNIARIVGSPRGMLISSVELSIMDLGGGTVKLYGDVLCHEPMEKIKLNLYLDKWISDNEDWSLIDNFNFTWLAEDYPGEELSVAAATVEVPNLERGIEYRLRGIAGAWDLDSNLYEVFRADTASILVE